MPTPQQLRTIHVCARRCGLIDGGDDTRYRLLLRNVGKVESSKLLDNNGVEDVLAVMEAMGADSHPMGKTYWQDKVRRRGSVASDRAVHLIRQLAAGGRYVLGTLCLDASDNRTDQVEQLTPSEAWKLTEALKAINARETQLSAAGQRIGPAASKEDAPLLDAAQAAREGGSGTTIGDDWRLPPTDDEDPVLRECMDAKATPA